MHYTTNFKQRSKTVLLTGLLSLFLFLGACGELATPTSLPTSTLAPVPTATSQPAQAAPLKVEVTVTPPPPTATNVPPTATPVPPTPAPAPTAVPAAAKADSQGVTFVEVKGTTPGRTASVTIQTSPDVTCSIEYIVPSKRVSTAQGLDPKVSDKAGRITWSWLISGNTGRGTGSVNVNYSGTTAKAPIVIG